MAGVINYSLIQQDQISPLVTAPYRNIVCPFIATLHSGQKLQ